mmetsp:Transcript_8833/g.12290  ORF Transcript_8833/g.12290 Transcript_8833/m.12290 type:complete len:226 (+) Transcript_8833:154-831(+)|eukprot:CAMPEP_0197295100 /NCGR_PEP_ID=MMETSP0890-20130614/34529_1 /TAXON_ID=44058 ORGANISM="Aureoumbra lagunensis, Strain CCMP1510" /NCGR_SAMPLE_ID=MMETSP0890 /ASSEMBLY_ACC=CAM_ASM_000533 /LENGTH=225 /DNA_ID=CAMNT_0042770869 /DNA_START=140 /DNA_END=817 /DNA_ORIENTATION=+
MDIEKAKSAASELHAKASKKAADWQSFVGKHKNLFTSSSLFTNMCKSVFEKVDIDSSGTVGVSECYVAILLFYLKLSVLVKGLTPPTIEDVRKFVRTVAAQSDGKEEEEVDLQEFQTLLTLLLEHLIRRVLLQIAIAFFIIPIIAAHIWDIYNAIYLKNTFVGSFIPRPIGVNLSVTLLLSTIVPFILKRFETSSVESIEVDALGVDAEEKINDDDDNNINKKEK